MPGQADTLTPCPRFLLRQGNNAATAASRVPCNVHQRNLVGARASTRPAHSMPVFIDESPGKRRRIDDTLYESNGSRIVVVNAFTSVNPETEQVVRTIN